MDNPISQAPTPSQNLETNIHGHDTHEPIHTQELPKSKPKIPIGTVIIILAITAGILMGVLFADTKTTRTQEVLVPTPTLGQPITPTPMRTLSPIASDSAFLSLESSVASLSQSLSNVQVTDPRLSPPSIELQLGFPTQ